MRVVAEKDGLIPERAHRTDAGLDLKAREDVVVPARGSVLVGTGVRVELPDGCCGLLVSKSGLNCKHEITSTGLIDEAYRGEILVKLYNHGEEDYHVREGDKVSQMVVIPVRYEAVELVESLDVGTDRGENGFGSTGR